MYNNGWLGKGSEVDVFNGNGAEFSGIIKSANKDSLIIEIKDTKSFRYDRTFKVTLYQAIPKNNKMDFIIEKAVELGVDSIVPIITERTVPDIRDKAKALKKKERWSKIAMASSKQCGRECAVSYQSSDESYICKGSYCRFKSFDRWADE